MTHRTRASGPDSSMETLAKLKPAFKPDGVVTAANSSQITDGSAAAADHERGEGQRARAHARGPASTRSRSPAWTR